MHATPTDLFDHLARQGIAVTTVEHPPLYTVTESKALRGQISGAHVKNLFLKDRKDNFFLLTVEEDASIDLKTIHHLIGASGKVSFGSAEKLQDMLGVLPGAVTPFAVINDREGRVRAFLDADLTREEVVNAHPLVNTATTSIAPADLIRFMRSVDHEPVILNLAG